MTEWVSQAQTVLASAEEIEFRPNRLFSALSSGRNTLDSLVRIVQSLTAKASTILQDVVARVAPSAPTIVTPTQLMCSGARKLDARSVQQSTVFSRDFQITSVQLGPFPVFCVPVVVGLSLHAHAHLNIEVGLCKITAGAPKGAADQIGVVADLV
jgi:hypothetical protein